METARIDFRDGWLCAVTETTEFNHPNRLTYWWPLTPCTPAQAEGWVGREAIYSGPPDYVYSVAIRPDSWLDRRSFRLPQGGQTEAVAVDVVAIPTPRVRPGIETRWRSGRWEKLLRKGWVPA